MPVPHFPHNSHMHSPTNPGSQRWLAKLILQNGFHRLCIDHACGSGQAPTQQSPQLVLVDDVIKMAIWKNTKKYSGPKTENICSKYKQPMTSWVWETRIIIMIPNLIDIHQSREVATTRKPNIAPKLT